MREIGSEFWDLPTKENIENVFQNSIQWFLSGRSALQAIVHELNDCHTVAMPSWCCDSMIKPFVNNGIEVKFYPVYWQNGLKQELNFDCDVLFVMDYFGYTASCVDLSDYKGVVIRDVTHSIFTSKYSDADYYFGSLRKWCGVWTGGYAWTKNGNKLNEGTSDDKGYIALRDKAMQLKGDYININRNAAISKEYLSYYNKAENILENIGIVRSSERDIKAAHKLDVEDMRIRRRANAEILRSAFSDWLVFQDMKDSDCPMFVPILVPNNKRDGLRNYLIKNEIYCPVHWPISEYHKFDERTDFIYKNELSLVCDQRYMEKDMYRVVKIINSFMEKQ